VVVVGRLRTNTWETPEGEKRSKVEIEAEEIGPSLKWATAKIEKQGRGQSDWTAGVAVGAGGPQGETPLDASGTAQATPGEGREGLAEEAEGEVLCLLQRERRVRRLQGREPSPEVHLGSRQDPRPA